MRHFLVISLLTVISLYTRAQSSVFERRIETLDSLHYADPREKIFIHHDKPSYQVKDTLWLKGYIVTAADHSPNDSSRIVYIEVINSENEIIKRINPVCVWGLFTSYIVLNNSDYQQGEYLLRAYTRHMRNFGDSLFFISRFKIIDPASPNWKMNFSKLSFEQGRFRLAARLSTEQDPPKRREEFTIRLFSKNKSVFRINKTPDSFSQLTIDSALNNMPSNDLAIEISDRNGWKLRLPINAGATTDIQFLPEGGTLLQNKTQRVGFKVLNNAGKGEDVQGVIKDQQDNIITRFKSIHKGMGSLRLRPEPGKTYRAVLDNGVTITLPAAVSSGHMLQVNNTGSKDSIYLKIDASSDRLNKWIYFTVTTRGTIRTWGRQKIKENAFELALAKKLFPQGVSVFTLYNDKLLPINERAFFIWHNEQLQLNASPHKPSYQNRDSVALVIEAKDNQAAPVTGSFSLSVIDTSQVAIQRHAENLLSYMLLSSDLRGVVEEPFLYLSDSASEAADALMLTQGWVSYQHMNQPRQFTYEKSFSISGTVLNIFNKSLAKSSITLFGRAGKNDMFLMDTTTNEKGQFVFTDFPLFDTDSISLVFKALNKRGKAFNVGIELEEHNYPIPPNNMILENAATIITDSSSKTYTQNQKQLDEELKKDGTYLKEVIVTAKVKIPGSKNLNSDGGSDQTINESTLDKTPKVSLLTVLQEQVKGFRTGTLRKSIIQRFMVNSNIARFIIDGTDLEFFYQPTGQESAIDYIQFYKGFLEYFSAEDIKGIEVMNTPRYNGTYRSRFLSIQELMNSGPATVDFSFIEITTRSGAGPFMKKTPGMYLLKPVFPFISKEFYSPRYASPDDKPVFPDYRTTVYWNGNIITDSSGKANLSFYTSESKGNYMMVLQGTDLKGRFGILYKPLFIHKEVTPAVTPK